MSQKVLFGNKPWKFNPTNSTDNKKVTSNKIDSTLSTEAVTGKDNPMLEIPAILKDLNDLERVQNALASKRPNTKEEREQIAQKKTLPRGMK